MALSYVPPGVLPATEITATPQASNVTSQVVPIIIGEASGYQTFSEGIQLSGTTASNFAKRGIDVATNGTTLYNLAVTATNPVNFESISPANFIVQKVSNGTATGDEQYSVKRAPLPGTPSLASGTASGTVVPSGSYRYGVSYLVDVNTGAGTTIYETGIGPFGTVTVDAPGGTVVISGMGNTNPAGFASANMAALGKNVYRSVNLGTDLNPNWGPYYKVSSGTAATVGIGTATYTDSEPDVTANSVALKPIESGDTINFQYNYTDTLYWEPTIFSDFNDVTDKYGDAFNSTGGINSEVSFAAKLTILNGAGTVVVAPIPANGEATDSNWEDVLLRLEEDEDGNVLIPLSGRTSVHALVSSHITKMKQRNVWKTAIIGMDSSGTATVTAESLRATAQAYNDEDLALVSPTIFNYYNSYLNTEVPIGGQYVAACLAGMHASRPLSDSLTRKQIAGISSVGEKRTTVGKNQDGQAGLLVVEQIPSTGSIRVRHEITTNPSNVNTREYPIILQRNNMVNIVAQELDRQVVGQILADTSAPSKVSLVVTQILDNLVATRNLGDYQGVSARFATNDPTVISVRWQYRPFYTIQYVQISFGINLTTGGITTGNVNLVL